MAQKSFARRRHSFHLFISSLTTTTKSALKRCEGRFHIVHRKESSPRYLIILFVIKFNNTISILYIYLIVDLNEREEEREEESVY